MTSLTCGTRGPVPVPVAVVPRITVHVGPRSTCRLIPTSISLQTFPLFAKYSQLPISLELLHLVQFQLSIILSFIPWVVVKLCSKNLWQRKFDAPKTCDKESLMRSIGSWKWKGKNLELEIITLTCLYCDVTICLERHGYVIFARCRSWFLKFYEKVEPHVSSSLRHLPSICITRSHV